MNITEASELPAKVAQLVHALDLELAGREQDRAELKIALAALFDIARGCYTGDDAYRRAREALKDIGFNPETDL